MSNPIEPRRPRKAADRPRKPYPDFPLTPHASGAWMKKIRGRIHYFGKWGRRVDGKLTRVPGDGWEEALRLYKAQADDLHAGRTPRVKADGLTVADLCNRFLTSKLRRQEAGEITARSFAEYRDTTDLLVASFGANRLVDDLAADDFEALRAAMARRWGPVRLGNAVGRVKGVFKYGAENGLIEKTVRFGSEFRKPDAAVLRRHRAKAGEKMFEAAELRALVDAADPQLRAMILLAVNTGLGNHDVAALPVSALDLERGWLDFPRPKTGVPRRSPLWPETIAAVRAALAERTKPADYPACGLAFVTPEGLAWVRHKKTAKGKSANADKVAVEFLKLTKKTGLHRPGRAFYSVRHTFRTVADATRDQPAADLIMGHAARGMRAVYVERIDDARLTAVTDHVRGWLWPKGGAGYSASGPVQRGADTGPRD